MPKQRGEWFCFPFILFSRHFSRWCCWQVPKPGIESFQYTSRYLIPKPQLYKYKSSITIRLRSMLSFTSVSCLLCCNILCGWQHNLLLSLHLKWSIECGHKLHHHTIFKQHFALDCVKDGAGQNYNCTKQIFINFISMLKRQNLPYSVCLCWSGQFLKQNFNFHNSKKMTIVLSPARVASWVLTPVSGTGVSFRVFPASISFFRPSSTLWSAISVPVRAEAEHTQTIYRNWYDMQDRKNYEYLFTKECWVLQQNIDSEGHLLLLKIL